MGSKTSVAFSSLLFEYLYCLVSLMRYRHLAFAFLLFSFHVLKEKSLETNNIFQRTDFFKGQMAWCVERMRTHSVQMVKDFHNLAYSCLFFTWKPTKVRSLLQGWRPEISKGPSGLVPSGGSRAESVSSPFPASRSCQLPWLLAPNSFDLCVSGQVPSSLTPTLPPPSL